MRSTPAARQASIRSTTWLYGKLRSASRKMVLSGRHANVRTMDQGFQQACERHGLVVSTRETRELDECRDTAVRLTEVWWSAQT